MTAVVDARLGDDCGLGAAPRRNSSRSDSPTITRIAAGETLDRARAESLSRAVSAVWWQ
jgi:hypothetical protein